MLCTCSFQVLGLEHKKSLGISRREFFVLCFRSICSYSDMSTGPIQRCNKTFSVLLDFNHVESIPVPFQTNCPDFQQTPSHSYKISVHFFAFFLNLTQFSCSF